MKIIFKYGFYALLLAAGTNVSFCLPVKPANNEAAAPASIRSVFPMPATPQEGRDPFFPDSMRLYKTAISTQVKEIANLAVNGFSGTPGNWTVIINNHSFGVGDEGDVLDSGGRVHIRCLKITMGRVIIEADGQKRELNF